MAKKIECLITLVRDYIDFSDNDSYKKIIYRNLTAEELAMEDLDHVAAAAQTPQTSREK